MRTIRGHAALAAVGLSCLWMTRSASAAVIFTEDFETGGGTSVPTGWTANNVPTSGVYTSAPPSAPPNAPSSTLSFVQADSLISRISKAFTASGSATSFKLSWYQYLNDSSTGTQRAIGQLSTGTAAAPGAGAFSFFRLGTVNLSQFGYIYNNGASTLTTATATNISAGWHLMSITVTPGTSTTFQVDAATPITITGNTTIPNVVTLGNNVANGTAGAPDTSAWFDSVKLEQFAPAAAKVTGPTPANGDAGDSVTQQLSWAAGANATAYDVYFDTNPTPTTLVSANQAGTSYDPGALLPGTTYYWEVNSKNVLGDQSVPGDVYSFTTASIPEPASLGSLLIGGLLLARRRRV
jgi:hypothetical protein